MSHRCEVCKAVWCQCGDDDDCALCPKCKRINVDSKIDSRIDLDDPDFTLLSAAPDKTRIDDG